MACLGIASDTRHFTPGQAWTMTAVTFMSPLVLLAIASSFVRRAPDGHRAKRLTGILCMLCVVPYPIAFLQLFALWFWNT